jgi:hypothetical protein
MVIDADSFVTGAVPLGPQPSLIARFKSRTVRIWRGFRSWPLWVQIPCWVVAACFSVFTLMAALLGLVVVLFLGLTFWRHPASHREIHKQLGAATKEVKSAESDHQKLIKTSEKQLAQVQKAYDKQVANYQSQLTALRNPMGRQLGMYQGCVLSELWISTPQGSGPVAGASASCDTASNMVVKSRATLTRMAAGGLVLGPLGAVLSLGFKKQKVDDHRELYLLIETSTFASVVECPPDQGVKARQFAAAVMTAGMNADAIAQQRPKQIATAEEQLATFQLSGGGVPEATIALDAVKLDPERLAAIEQRRAAVATLAAPIARSEITAGDSGDGQS